MPIITLAAIDFVSSKELMTRVPQLYEPSWFHPPLTRLSFAWSVFLSILEAVVILGLCFLFFPYWCACDVTMNMVTDIASLHRRASAPPTSEP